MIEIGQHVVCVEDRCHPEVLKLYTRWVKNGEQYVVRDIRLGVEPLTRKGELSLLLVGVVNPPTGGHSKLERGFAAWRFLPIEEAKALLAQIKSKIDKKAVEQTTEV